MGKTLFGVSLLENQAYLMDQLLNLVRDLRPDVLVITGDVFDQASPEVEAVALLETTVSRLILELKCRVVIVKGQHDRPERLGLNSRLLQESGLYLITNHRQALSPLELETEVGQVRFWFLPYLEVLSTRRFLEREDIRDPLQASRYFLEHLLQGITFTGINCLFGYTWVEGAVPSGVVGRFAGSRSLPLPRTLLEGFDYVGLGFIHTPMNLGSPRQRYAGSLARYSLAEVDDSKSLTFVELQGPGLVSVESFPLGVRHQLRRFKGTVDELLTGPEAGARGDYIILQITDREPEAQELHSFYDLYPNLVYLETPLPDVPEVGRLTGELGPYFRAFFNEVTGKELEPDQEEALETVVKDLK